MLEFLASMSTASQIQFNVLTVLGYGVLVGIITGLMGVGGGTLVVPFLTLYLRLPIKLALGTSLFQITGIASSGAYQHFKLGSADLKLAAILAASGGGMAYLGATTAQYIPGELLKGVFGVFVIFIAIRFMRGGKAKKREKGPEQKMRIVATHVLPICVISHHIPLHIPRHSRLGVDYEIPLVQSVLLGGVVGFFSGILGVGGGFLLVPGLVFLGIPIKIAVGTDLAQIVASSIVGASTYFRHGDVDLVIGLLLMAGGIAGTVIGTRLNRWIRPVALRKVFGGIMIPIGLLMIRSALGH
jgi:hypothetical protein